MKWEIVFKPQDLWVGVYWESSYPKLDIWICVIPMVPLHLYWRRATD